MASEVTHISAYSAASSALYQSTLESSGIQRETFTDRLNQTRQWLFNPQEETVMGRSIVDHLFYAIAYGLFYLGLFGMTAVFFSLFYWAIDWNFPELQGSQTILQVPGLGFRPQPDASNTIVRFIKGDGSTYMHYLDHIESYVQYYENELQVGDNYKDCNTITKRRTEDLDRVCVFDIKDLGEDCVKQQNYGFDDGQPCVLIKINRIFDWMPEEYNNASEVPDYIKDMWDKWHVTLKCDGDDDATRENMGELSYYPPNGFHFKYFPFRNQQGYRSPLAMLRFENPHPGILLMMTCRIFAKNIIFDRNSMVGQVHFEVMVD